MVWCDGVSGTGARSGRGSGSGVGGVECENARFDGVVNRFVPIVVAHADAGDGAAGEVCFNAGRVDVACIIYVSQSVDQFLR